MTKRRNGNCISAFSREFPQDTRDSFLRDYNQGRIKRTVATVYSYTIESIVSRDVTGVRLEVADLKTLSRGGT